MKKIIPFLVIIIFGTFIWIMTERDRNKGLIETIKLEMKGKLLNQESVHRGYIWTLKNHEDTFKFKSLFLNFELYDKLQVGDSIVKRANSNYCFIYRPDTVIKLYWANISNESRNHWTFPDEWKDKWLEASEYDKD